MIEYYKRFKYTNKKGAQIALSLNTQKLMWPLLSGLHEVNSCFSCLFRLFLIEYVEGKIDWIQNKYFAQNYKIM